MDYSGRSVIVVGPELKLHQCGLPKKMALILFEPFIIRRLKERGHAHTVRSAKRMIEREEDIVWDILDEVTRGHTVMLNRAPTLQRLSIQSFEPILIEGQAIQLHPLVCAAYNADFDGDQMAVHVPLSVEAQLESRALMLASNNIFSPASGKPITTPSQDITLGCYFITSEAPSRRLGNVTEERMPIFADAFEVHTAYEEGAVKIDQRIRFRNPDRGRDTIYGEKDANVIVTTVGRVFFNEVWPEELGFVNKVIGKKDLGKLIWQSYQHAGHKRTVKMLDDLKDLGFEQAMLAGISISMVDMIIPEGKPEMIAGARDEIREVEAQFAKGIITEGERYNKIIDIWTHTNEELTNDV